MLIDNHRKEREEHARQAYIQRQASKLLDVTAKEFTPVAMSCHLFGEASAIYMVKRNDNEGKEGRFSLVCCASVEPTSPRAAPSQQTPLVGVVLLFAAGGLRVQFPSYLHGLLQ